MNSFTGEQTSASKFLLYVEPSSLSAVEERMNEVESIEHVATIQIIVATTAKKIQQVDPEALWRKKALPSDTS
jgi:hypothetical protein